MDLFAAILVTITAVTICGICLFIFVCALQPRFLRKLHGKTSRTYRDTDSNAASNEDELSAKSLDPSAESGEPSLENPSTAPDSTNRDKKAYLRSLERSLRTGRRIHDDKNDDDHSPSTPFKFIRHCINKYVRRKRTDAVETTEL